jgi:hypothetical protein
MSSARHGRKPLPWRPNRLQILLREFRWRRQVFLSLNNVDRRREVRSESRKIWPTSSLAICSPTYARCRRPTSFPIISHRRIPSSCVSQKWAREHLKEGFSLKDAANALATGVRSLQRRCQAVLGKSPLDACGRVAQLRRDERERHCGSNSGWRWP